MADLLTPDLCVIGAGTGGLAVAEAARAYGLSVVLVERARLGGNALHAGAIPAQALGAAAARAYAMRTAGAFGITADEIKVNYRRVHDHVSQVVQSLAPEASDAHLEALGVTILRGEARFADRRLLAVGDMQVRARRFVIATGATPVVPPIPGLDAVPYFTTDTILDNTRKLTHLLVVGGDALGLGLAQSHARLGSQVTLLDADTPLADIDRELSAVALRRIAEDGVSIRTHTRVTAIHARSMGIGVAVHSGETSEMLDVSHILLATARMPNLDALDLDKAGVRRDRDDPKRLHLVHGLRTSNPKIFAVGDVTGAAQSGQSAARQAERVIRNLVLGLPLRNDPLGIPALVHTDPAIARIGLDEAAARKKYGTRFRVSRWSFADNVHARTTRQTYGLAKLVTDPRGRILGATVVGAGAGELIALFSFALANRLGLRHLSRLVAPYPSFAEIATRLGTELDKQRVHSAFIQRWIALIRLFS